MQTRKGNKAWVWLASAALAAFTVFVLLDTFAIARVQQQVADADTATLFAQTAQAAETDEAHENSSGDAESAQSSEATYYSDHGAGRENTSNNGQASKEAQTNTDTSLESEGNTQNSGASAGDTQTDSSTSGLSSDNTADATTYSDEHMTIQLTTTRAYDTTVYIADIQVDSAEYLKTALAGNAFGRNIKAGTSDIAESVGAVLAINGDYYGFRDDGYVLRNGVLYREVPTSGTDALVVYSDGTMASASQDSISAQELADAGAWQVLSFGPTLIEDGQLAVAEGQEVTGRSMASNPRTAIGMVEPLHYLVVVSDGRSSGEAGLSLAQLAQVLKDAGATYAYNLDGGGSTTLYFQGEIINNPTGGRGSSERSVSDIVYFG